MHNTTQPRTRRAFTLLELMIIVVILGILAAIVGPQFSGAAEQGYTGNIQSQLARLQRQIELYIAREGAAPDFASQGWNDMISRQYIRSQPRNPAFKVSGVDDFSIEVVTGTTAGSATAAWVWNSDRGLICASNFREAAFYTTDVELVTATPED